MNVYPDHESLQYFKTKKKLNARQGSWYLQMSEFRYNIHYRPGTKMGKPDGLSRRSGEEKSGMDAKFFEEGQLLDLREAENDNECYCSGQLRDYRVVKNSICVSRGDRVSQRWKTRRQVQ